MHLGLKEEPVSKPRRVARTGCCDDARPPAPRWVAGETPMGGVAMRQVSVLMSAAIVRGARKRHERDASARDRAAGEPGGGHALPNNDRGAK